MVDPKTGKFFYEEPEPEINVAMSGEPSLKNLDLDGDGVVEEEELQQVFDEADTNDDGYIDEEEAKAANLDPTTATKLNELNEQVEGVVDTFKQYYALNPEQSNIINQQMDKIKKLSMELGSLKNKKDDDNTITYF
jgi:ribosome assembly protein YihI (activator of Der GTPase)